MKKERKKGKKKNDNGGKCIKWLERSALVDQIILILIMIREVNFCMYYMYIEMIMIKNDWLDNVSY